MSTAIPSPPASTSPTEPPCSTMDFSHPDPAQCPLTMLTFFKGPTRQKQTDQNHIRQSISFGFVSNKPHQPQQQQQQQQHGGGVSSADRPRVVTNWKSESETHREISISLDQPPLTPSPGSHRFSCSSHHRGERIEPLHLKPIPSEVLLPFDRRETEFMTLLTEPQNVGLYNRLKDCMKSDLPVFEAEVLRASRSAMGDREWILAIRGAVTLRDNTLWVSLRGLMGADGLDTVESEMGAGDQIQIQMMKMMEHGSGWHVQPHKIRRRASMRSNGPDTRRRTLFNPPHSRSFSEPSLFSGFSADSDLDSISVISQSPRTRMASIKEHDALEGDENLPNNNEHEAFHSPSSTQLFPESGDDQPDENHILALKILDAPVAESLLLEQENSTQKYPCPFLPHGLKYSFGKVVESGLGLQSLNNIA
ncbi:hypothetical protein PCANC_19322 [Puccinia coronata f. sp. avenae]|uniref:Uncharacterized protein n=1 Tax=Puccinia coronata f. sp. avenae TaxID=200324 RepID=A0A2N5SIJ4_9BASI|nr:hypothetical protein PCANC_19322 [Puccinia coronata f. sp. avenae]